MFFFHAVMRKVTGFPAPSGFGINNLFTLRFGNRKTFNDYMSCGGASTTPALNEISASWPHPRAFSQTVLLFLLVMGGLSFAAVFFGDRENCLEVSVGGAMAFPIAYAMFFFDLNVSRNISLFEIIRLIALGGILSHVIALLLYELSHELIPRDAIGWDAAFIEEPAKLIAAVLLAGGIRDFKWTLNGVLIGAAVGAGFAALENIIYLFPQIESAPRLVFPVIFGRGITIALMHVAFTGAVAGALWRAKGAGPFSFALFLKPMFLRVLLLAIGLHLLNNWLAGMKTNTGISLLLVKQIPGILLLLCSVYVVLSVAQMGLDEVREAQAKQSASQNKE